MSLKDTIVIDLDGTLSDVAHRRHLVTGKHRDYEAFHALLKKDPCNEWCKRLMAVMWAAGYDVEIVSARPMKHDEATREWLRYNEVCFTGVNLLRPDGDSTPDQELKMAWLRNYDPARVLFVVDDRQKVVDAWRAAGVTCLQCDAWKEK